MKRLVSAACALVLLVGVGGAVRADDQKDLNDLIAKAIKAHGGAENIAKVKATVSKGKGKFYGAGDDGIDYTGVWSYQAPNRLRVEITSMAGGDAFKFIQVYDGDKGWMSLQDSVMDLDDAHLKELREEMHADRLSRLIHLTDKDCKLSPLGEVKVEKRPAIGVRVECKGHRDVSLFFDKETNQLVKLERRGNDPEGGKEFNQEDFYSDYKKVDGALVPFKQTIKRDGKTFVENEFTSVENKDKLDDKPFKKP